MSVYDTLQCVVSVINQIFRIYRTKSIYSLNISFKLYCTLLIDKVSSVWCSGLNQQIIFPTELMAM